MPDLLKLSSRAQRCIVLLLACATFLLTLGKRDIATSHEARVALTARVMAESGWPWNAKLIGVPTVSRTIIDGKTQLRPSPGGKLMPVNPWLVPVMNGQIRLQKPPLPYWCAAVLFRMFGEGEGVSRFIPALLGVFTTLLIYDLATMLLGRRAGVIAACVWLTTGHFVVDEYRKAMADPYLSFFTLLCVWAWFRITLKCRRPWGVLYAVFFYTSLGLGFLAKGPVIFLTVLIPLVALYVIRRRFRRGPIVGHLVGMILFLLMAAPWFVYCYRHVPNALDLWRYESVGEVSGENIEKARPWFMYIGNAFEIAMPWTPLWIGGIFIAFLHRRRGIFGPRGRRRMIAILWYALILIFFSILPVKKKAYLLPAMPAQTLIITDGILILLAFAKRTWISSLAASRASDSAASTFSDPLSRKRQQRADMSMIVATAQALIGIGAAVRITMLLFHAQLDRTSGIICGVIATLACLCVIRPIVNRAPSKWFTLQVIAYAMLTIVLLGFQRADEQNRRSAKPFARALQTYLPTQNLPLLVHWLPEEVAYYMPLNIPDAGDSPYALMVVDHSAKDPTESPLWFSQLMGDVRVIDARPVDLHAPDGNGRWKLFELTLDRQQRASGKAPLGPQS